MTRYYIFAGIKVFTYSSCTKCDKSNKLMAGFSKDRTFITIRYCKECLFEEENLLPSKSLIQQTKLRFIMDYDI